MVTAKENGITEVKDGVSLMPDDDYIRDQTLNGVTERNLPEGEDNAENHGLKAPEFEVNDEGALEVVEHVTKSRSKSESGESPSSSSRTRKSASSAAKDPKTEE